MNVRWVVVADGERRQVQLAIGGGGHVAVGDRVGDGSDRDLARPNDDRERPRIGPRSVGRRDPNGRGDGRGAREQDLSAFTPASARGEQRRGGPGGRRQLKQTLQGACPPSGGLFVLPLPLPLRLRTGVHSALNSPKIDGRDARFPYRLLVVTILGRRGRWFKSTRPDY